MAIVRTLLYILYVLLVKQNNQRGETSSLIVLSKSEKSVSPFLIRPDALLPFFGGE